MWKKTVFNHKIEKLSSKATVEKNGIFVLKHTTATKMHFYPRKSSTFIYVDSGSKCQAALSKG